MLLCFCSTFKFQREKVEKLDGVPEKLCYVLPWCSSMGPLGEVRGWSPPVPRYLTRFNKGRKFSSFIAWISYKLKHSTLTKRRQRQWQHQHQQRGGVLPFRDTWRTTIKEDNSSLNGIEKISSKVVKLMISCHNIEQLFANSQWCILWTLWKHHLTKQCSVKAYPVQYLQKGFTLPPASAGCDDVIIVSSWLTWEDVHHCLLSPLTQEIGSDPLIDSGGMINTRMKI